MTTILNNDDFSNNRSRHLFSATFERDLPLPDWALDIVLNPPPSGQGFHNWLYRAARACLKCGKDIDEVCWVLIEAAAHCGRLVPYGEIRSALIAAKKSVDGTCALHGKIEKYSKQQKRSWPKLDDQKITEICSGKESLQTLVAKSPVRLDAAQRHTEEILDVFFPGNPLLCLAKTLSQFHTLAREGWRGYSSDLQFIVPSPMAMPTGITKDGKVSHRCLDNTGERRFLVVEFDQGTLDEHASKLLHLSNRLPLALVVYSGGKSLHGWFYCFGRLEDHLRLFMEYAVSIGADSATWTPCQLVRLPDGLRQNGKRQLIHYFAPEVIV